MKTPLFLYLTVLVIATCGLIYELVVGATASYLLGSSVTQFSLVIGLYLFAMGIGAWLSGHIENKLAQRFVEAELAVALVGGLCAPLLFWCFGQGWNVRLWLVVLVLVIGTLVGLEVPLLIRLLKERVELKQAVARVLSFDYIGALFAALLFPMLFLPSLGLLGTSIAFGLLNAAVAFWSTFLLELPTALAWRLRALAVGLSVGLGALLVYGDALEHFLESRLYAEPVLHSESTPYQRIVVTGSARQFSLFLDGRLQFNSRDEYRYHEALVHPAIAHTPRPVRALVLGGGDGLAVRELLRYPHLESILLVDLDARMTQLAQHFGPLSHLNQRALLHPKVHILNADAMQFLAESPPLDVDVAIVDFPDPNNFALGKLYSSAFYRLLKKHLAPQGVASIQSTSPLTARKSFWCIEATLRDAGLNTLPFRAQLPSFGEWGFILASALPLQKQHPLPSGLRYLNEEVWTALLSFPEDMKALPSPVNRLNRQTLVHLYSQES